MRVVRRKRIVVGEERFEGNSGEEDAYFFAPSQIERIGMNATNEDRAKEFDA